MELWKGKVAVVTGASAGIGARIARDLCLQGIIVVGFSRRLDRLEKLRQEIQEVKKDAQFFPVQCDLAIEDEIRTAFEYVVAKLGGVDILVNNAGMVTKGLVLGEANIEKLSQVIHTNITAVVSCTQKAFKSMKERDVPGYIINISSIAGHTVPNYPDIMNVYPSTKHAITALNKVIRHELNHLKRNNIRISNISPGAVLTEIMGTVNIDVAAFKDIMLPEDISEIVLYFLRSNPRVQVEDVIVYPTGGY